MYLTLSFHIKEVLSGLGLKSIPFSLERPAKQAHGDYATNAAIIAAKKTGADPHDIAESIKKKLAEQVPDIDTIEIAGPGFINFHLSRHFFTKEIIRAIDEKSAWMCSKRNSNKKVVIEYTSPNLFKPLHIGNLVGNIIGESLARLYECTGSTVYRVNYPSDIGLTVAKGVWGIKKTGGNPDDIDDIGQAYVIGNNAYEEDADAKKEIEEINRELYSGTNTEINKIREQGIETSLERITELCSILGTSFDAEFYESEAGPVGASIVQKHIGDIFEESDGAIVYRGEKAGLHTRVFLNSQGLPTYEAKDLGNYVLKQQKYPNHDSSLVVTGNEQREYFKVVIAAIREVFPEARNKTLEHIPTGFLTLTTGKMSSRKGNVLTGESLIDDLRKEAVRRAKETRANNISVLSDMIAVAALKYQILRQKTGSNITFDKKQAFSFEGDSGPYLQYTHARIVSVLEQAHRADIEMSPDNATAEPYEIERFLHQFPEVIDRALTDKSPHHVLGFLTELASIFNRFYSLEKIADKTDEHAPYKVMVAKAVQQTLEDGLWILGIGAPERM